MNNNHHYLNLTKSEFRRIIAREASEKSERLEVIAGMIDQLRERGKEIIEEWPILSNLLAIEINVLREIEHEIESGAKWDNENIEQGGGRERGFDLVFEDRAFFEEGERMLH